MFLSSSVHCLDTKQKSVLSLTAHCRAPVEAIIFGTWYSLTGLLFTLSLYYLTVTTAGFIDTDSDLTSVSLLYSTYSDSTYPVVIKHKLFIHFFAVEPLFSWFKKKKDVYPFLLILVNSLTKLTLNLQKISLLQIDRQYTFVYRFHE